MISIKKKYFARVLVAIILSFVGLFVVQIPLSLADATECTNSGGTYNSSGLGTCTCPSGTAINDVCFSGPGDNNGNVGGDNTNGGVDQTNGGITSPGSSGKIVNPLKSEDIPDLLLKIIDVLLVFALPIIVLYIMYAGYLFVTSAGNAEKVTDAKNALLWSIVGGVIVLGARVIISVIQGTITAF